MQNDAKFVVYTNAYEKHLKGNISNIYEYLSLDGWGKRVVPLYIYIGRYISPYNFKTIKSKGVYFYSQKLYTQTHTHTPDCPHWAHEGMGSQGCWVGPGGARLRT